MPPLRDGIVQVPCKRPWSVGHATCQLGDRCILCFRPVRHGPFTCLFGLGPQSRCWKVTTKHKPCSPSQAVEWHRWASSGFRLRPIWLLTARPRALISRGLILASKSLWCRYGHSQGRDSSGSLETEISSQPVAVLPLQDARYGPCHRPLDRGLDSLCRHPLAAALHLARTGWKAVPSTPITPTQTEHCPCLGCTTRGVQINPRQAGSTRSCCCRALALHRSYAYYLFHAWRAQMHGESLFPHRYGREDNQPKVLLYVSPRHVCLSLGICTMRGGAWCMVLCANGHISPEPVSKRSPCRSWSAKWLRR